MRRAERLWMEHSDGSSGRLFSFALNTVARPGYTGFGDPVLGDRVSRRNLMKAVGTLAGGSLLCQAVGCKQPGMSRSKEAAAPAGGPADYTLTIAVKPVELAPKRIVSTTTYNGQFPGPLLRFQEGRQVTIDIHNQTDTPEQLHWHGQFLPTDVDGAAEEGTPFIPAPGSRRIAFVPKPSWYRFYKLTRVAGQATSSVIKDVVMVGGFQEVEIDVVADNPGLTLFHCHQQLHMDFGFMSLFEYV